MGAFVGMYLANAVAQCAEEVNFPIDNAFQATCASDVQQVVGAMGSVASGGSEIAYACGKVWPQHAPFSTKRHLTPEDYLKHLESQKIAFRDATKGDRRKLMHWVQSYMNRTDDGHDNHES